MNSSPHIVIAQLSPYLWSQRNLDLCTTSSSKSSASSYQQMLHHNDNILVTSHLWIKRNLDPGLSSLDLCTTSTPKSSASELSKLKNPPQHFQTLGDNSEKKHFFPESLHHVGRQANSPLPDVVSRSEVFFSAAKYTDPADCSDLSKPSQLLFSYKSNTFPENLNYSSCRCIKSLFWPDIWLPQMSQN